MVRFDFENNSTSDHNAFWVGLSTVLYQSLQRPRVLKKKKKRNRKRNWKWCRSRFLRDSVRLRTRDAPSWRQDQQHHDVLQHVRLECIQVSRRLASLGQTDLKRETSFVLRSKARALRVREKTDEKKGTDENGGTEKVPEKKKNEQERQE